MDELFDGIEIMDASEIEASIAQKAAEEKGEEFKGVSEEVEIIVPGATTQTKSEEAPVTTTTSNENREVIYKGLIKELYDSNIITLEESEELEKLEGSLDTIKQLMAKTVTRNVESSKEEWKKGFSGSKKRFLEIEDSFDDSDNAIMMAERLEFLETITDEAVKSNVELQKQLYAESLKIKGFSNEKIQEHILDAIALQKLESKSLEAINELKEESKSFVEEAKTAKEQKIKEEVENQTKTFEKLVATIEGKEFFVEGLALNKTIKDKLKSNIVTPVYTDPKTKKEYTSLMDKQRRNPVEFEMLINYLDVIGVFNIDKDNNFKPDISKLKAVAKTAAITELDKVIDAEASRGLGRNTSTETSKTTDDVLRVLKGAFNK